MNPLIQLVDLQKTYRIGSAPVQALRNVSLEVAPGEFVAIMGASGSGKSTLMNLIGCLDVPDHGQYRLDGVEVTTLDSDALAALRNRKLGFVFQNFNLLARASALDNVELPLHYSADGLAAGEYRQRARQALELVGLARRADHEPSQLSGGEQQRVAIARALVNQPSVLLADEPTGNLDSRTSLEVMAVFQRLHRQGLTLVMVTHEPDIAQHAERVIEMRDGRILRDRRIAAPLDANTQLADWQEAPAEETVLTP